MVTQPRTFSLTQGKPNDERAYRPRSTSTASSKVYCCGDKEDVYSPGGEKANTELPRMNSIGNSAVTTKLPSIALERGASVTFETDNKQQLTLSDDASSQQPPSETSPPLSLPQVQQQALFPVEPPGKAEARGGGGGAVMGQSRKVDEASRLHTDTGASKSAGAGPETTRRASLATSAASLHTAPAAALSVGRTAVPTTRALQWNSSLGSGSASVVERLPPIATQEKDKFARLTAGDSVVVRTQGKRNSASSSGEVARRGSAPATRRCSQAASEDGSGDAAQRATRRIALKLEIATALKEIDFAALQDELRVDPRHAVNGGRYLAARSLFRVLTHERSVLTRDDLHDLLVLFTPPGAARHEATDFFWEACDHGTQLTLTQFIRYGSCLRERLFAYDHFAHITDSAQRLVDIATRVLGATAVTTSGTPEAKELCAKLLTMAARQIDGVLPADVRPLRVYEYDFLLDYDSNVRTTGNGDDAEARRVRRGVLGDVAIPAQRAPYVRDAPGAAGVGGEDISWLATDATPPPDAGRHDEARSGGGDRSSGQGGAAAAPRAGTRGGLQSRGRPPCLSEDHLAMTNSDTLDDTMRRRVRQMLKVSKAGTRSQGGCAMLDVLAWGEKERREQDELFIKRLYNKYNLPCN